MGVAALSKVLSVVTASSLFRESLAVRNAYSLSGVGLSAGGATWKVLHQSRIYDTLVADPGRRGRMWLGAADGLYRSDDGGATVTKVTDGPVGAIFVRSW